MTTSANEAAFARELAVGVVADLYPDETPFFDELAMQYPGEPADEQRDSPLGFGLNEAVQLFTPMILAAAVTVANGLLALAADAVKAEMGERLKGSLKKVLNPKAPKEPLTLSTEQLARVHREAAGQLTALGVDEPTATRIADALIGRVVLAT